MKKTFLIFFSLFSLFSFAQKINDYEFIMVPTKFDFQSDENEYRLNTLLKFRLEEYGFKAFYTSDQLNTNYSDRCLYLNASVVNESSMFMTKFYVVFKDCNNNIVFQSEIGTSKVKARKDAYKDALEEALKSVKAINYKFNGKNTQQVALKTDALANVKVDSVEVISENSLFAQPIANGFQLVDATPKVVLKILKTSLTDYFMATSVAKNGIVFKKNNEWIFEYYLNEKLISEKLIIKF